jgi:hypothetical protein
MTYTLSNLNKCSGGNQMSKYCPLCDAITNCTDNCIQCLKEEVMENQAQKYKTNEIRGNEVKK